MNSISLARAFGRFLRSRGRAVDAAVPLALNLFHRSALLLGSALLMVGGLAATARATDPIWNYAVQLSAVVEPATSQITLQWVQDTVAIPQAYVIARKAPEAPSWTTVATLAGSTTAWTDVNVTRGVAYEYQVTRVAVGYNGYGYIQAGIAVPLNDVRGKVILIVERAAALALPAELTRLQSDLVGDGWSVVRHEVDRGDCPASVKALIAADYAADPANVRAVFLFGRVPVPYAGRLAPDGHVEHMGAWPADLYYGDIDGQWTDNTTNYTQCFNSDPAEAQRLTNVVGDGKFDFSAPSAPVRLQVGRVDLANMPGRVNGVPTFASEIELLRQYLNKDHNFRHAVVRPQRRALVGDYFGAMGGEAFAASGYRSFAPLVGATHITNLNAQYGDTGGVWVPTLATADHLLAYGCGPGWYQGMAGIGTTTDIVQNNVQAAFVLMCGSWLGDWDHEDNVMRSILATRDVGLVAAWSGRPHWFLHPLGLGETVGFCARLTQNNNAGLYRSQISNFSGMVHVALMGDPTLRLFTVAPPTNLTGVVIAGGITLNWSGSRDAVAGYHVYRAKLAAGPYVRLTGELVGGNSFVDTTAGGGESYLVRAVRLETTPSGSFYNGSQGAFWTNPAAPADVVPPTVAITAPAASATVAGSVVLAAIAADDVGVAGVQFQLDGRDFGGELCGAPYQLVCDTSRLADGTHVVAAVARDAAGNRAVAAPISFFVRNTVVDTTAPLIALISPAAGTSAGGTAFSLSADASDNVAVAGVQFLLDGVPLGAEVTAAPYRYSWDTTAAANTTRTLSAVARDAAGNRGASAVVTVTVSNAIPMVTNSRGDAVWFDDALPAGAVPTAGVGGDRWDWVSSAPTPWSGTRAHQSTLAAGWHEHGFHSAGAVLPICVGDTLFVHVYLDPANPPREIMLTWKADNAEHRAYWGNNKIDQGKPGSASRRFMGRIPAAGQWILLSVRASEVGLEGQTVTGMTFALYDGCATWDFAGKIGPR